MKKLLFYSIFIIILTVNMQAYQIAPLYDFWQMIKSPFSLEKENLTRLGIITAVAVPLFLLDNDIKKYVQKNKNEGFDRFLKIPEKMGEGWYLMPVSGLFILSGEISSERSLTRLGIYTLEGFFISGITVQFVKFVTGRSRPYKDEGAHFYRPFSLGTGNKSFYSGHTTVAFTFASVVAHFSDNIYLGAILYGMATLTGLARIYHNKHWASDVFIGAVTGHFIGKAIVDYNEIEVTSQKEKDEIKLTLWKGGF
ncbi:MAG: phosphatase PAP2 family protein [Spirochaetes bacterium]|nr:phosphatase PAP2 family protein [Spirochaetota bacterium]